MDHNGLNLKIASVDGLRPRSSKYFVWVIFLIPKIAIFNIDDSGKMVGIFEEINWKITSGGQNLKTNL